MAWADRLAAIKAGALPVTGWEYRRLRLEAHIATLTRAQLIARYGGTGTATQLRAAILSAYDAEEPVKNHGGEETG